MMFLQALKHELLPVRFISCVQVLHVSSLLTGPTEHKLPKLILKYEKCPVQTERGGETLT